MAKKPSITHDAIHDLKMKSGGRQPGQAIPTTCPFCGASFPSKAKYEQHLAAAADELHDAGGGYNANNTVPQK